MSEPAFQLSVLILNLSDIFLLAVARVLSRHAVPLLLPGLLRLLLEYKWGKLGLFHFDLHPTDTLTLCLRLQLRYRASLSSVSTFQL